MKKTLLSLAAAIGFASLSQAALITPVSSSHTGPLYAGVVDSRIIDGVIPNEGEHWNTASLNTYWYGLSTVLKVDLGALYTITDILVSVDNNDNYLISYSANGSTWNSLATVLYYYGERGYGMDTMSSDSSHGEYVSGIDFSSVNARYLSIQAIQGGQDLYNSVGEIQAFGRLVGVPDSGSTALLTLLGLTSLVALRKRFSK